MSASQARSIVVRGWMPNPDTIITDHSVIRLSVLRSIRREESQRSELLHWLKVHHDSAFSLGTRLRRCELCRKIHEAGGSHLWPMESILRDHDRTILGHHGELKRRMYRIEGGAGSTYWIDPDGNDTTGDGSEGTPWATFGKAKTVMIAGDTLMVNPGSYTSNDNWSLSAKAGTAGSQYYVQASDPGDRPIVIPGSGNRVLYLDHASSYWNFTDIIFDGTNVGFDTCKIDRTGDGSTNLTWTRCVFRNSATAQGILVVSDCNNQTWVDCDFHGNGNSDLDHGMYLQTSGNVVLGGTAYNNAGYGYQIYPGATTTTVDKVISHENGTTSGGGLIFQGNTNICRNSIFWGNQGSAGFGVQLYGGGSGTENALYNATLVDNAAAALVAHERSLVKNVVMRTQTSYGEAEVVTASSPFINGVDVTSDPYAGFGSDVHVQADGDPGFVAIGSNDYHPDTGSPLIDTGVDTSGVGVTVDLDGNSRPQGAAFDIGAYEFVVVATQESFDALSAGFIAIGGGGRR